MKEKKRLLVIAFGVFFLFSLLIVQYFKIQIIESDRWTKEALSQHEYIVKEPFKRGAFYSNTFLKKGHPETQQPFVFDVTKYHLYVDPVSIPEPYRKDIAENLIRLGQFESDVMGELEKKSRSRRLATWLDRDKKESILKWWQGFIRKKKIPRNAIYFIADYQRCYPFGKLLGQVLHTIREMKDETTSEAFPTGGLEAYFNDYLKGKIGKRMVLRSPLNHLEIDKVIEEPEDGADIYLTINHCIQAIVEEELEKGILAARAKGGWSVMIDPHTGEILALAQYPFFEPAHYRDFFNDPEKIEIAKVKAISDAFELGSIMKPITMAAGLKANAELEKQKKNKIFDPAAKMDTTRSIFPGRASKPLRDNPPHRFLNMYMALQRSSNVYMAQIIDRIIKEMGNDWYRKTLVETFGFDQKTGIELPAEATGTLPTPGKLHPNGTLEWSLPTPYSLAIGYNLLATSLQMARAYCVFANGGYLIQPTLVRKIVKGGEVIMQHDPLLKRKKVLEESYVKEVVKGMKFTTKMNGTGRLAAINGYSEAGKTGTAEKIVGGVYSEESYISSFIGFAPANLEAKTSPRFVLIVTIDEPAPIFLEGGVKNYGGGRCAAPVFREIARKTLEYLGEPPDDPFGYPPGDPRYDPKKADWAKEVEELRSLYEQWNSK